MLVSTDLDTLMTNVVTQLSLCDPCGVVVHRLVVHTPLGGRAPFSGSRTPGDRVVCLRSTSPYGIHGIRSTELPVVVMAYCGPCGVGCAPISGSHTLGWSCAF